jgi:hypothetical protein
MEPSALESLTSFHVVIEYRTPKRLRVWSGLIEATSHAQADQKGRDQLRKRCCVDRIDRVVVR